MWRRSIRSVLAPLVVVVLTAAGCTSEGGSSPTQSPGTTGTGPTEPTGPQAPPRQAGDDTVVIAWTGDLNSLDPPDSLVEWNREVSLALYDTLLTYKLDEQPDGSLVWDGLEVAPGLAERWEVDGASVTFFLRQDVTFNRTGNPLTAEDVKYSFVRAPEVPGFGRFNSNLAGIFEPDRQIEVIDDYTIRFTFELSDGTPHLLTASLPSLRFPIFGIVDSKEVQSHVTADDPWGYEWLKENGAGSGPYVIDSRTPGTETILRAVPNHWSGQQGFDQVVFRVFASPADIVSLMLRGEVDLTASLPDRELQALREAGFTIMNAPIPDIWRLDLPVDVPPLDMVEVRQAIAYALPYDTIITRSFVQAERAYSYVNPAAPEFVPAWDMYQTNMDTARELLDQAGVGDGFNIDLYYDSGVTTWEDIALFIQASLGEIGIQVSLKPLPTATFAEQSTAMAAGEDVMPGLALRRGVIWLDDAAPNTGLWILSNGFNNATHYGREDLDQLHLENEFNSNLEERTQAYQLIQRESAEDVPLIPLAVRGHPVAVHPDITGVAFTADPHLRVHLIRLRTA